MEKIAFFLAFLLFLLIIFVVAIKVKYQHEEAINTLCPCITIDTEGE